MLLFVVVALLLVLLAVESLEVEGVVELIAPELALLGVVPGVAEFEEEPTCAEL